MSDDRSEASPRSPTGAPAATRHAIIRAAEAILAEEGMPGLNVSAIMRRAGISRTAFYRVFDDVYGVVTELVEALGAELASASGTWYRGETGSPDVIHGSLLSYARAFARYGPILEGIRQAGEFDEDVYRPWRGLVGSFSDAAEIAIRRDQLAGAIDRAWSSAKPKSMGTRRRRVPVGGDRIELPTSTL